MSTISVIQWPRYLFMVTVYRRVINEIGIATTLFLVWWIFGTLIFLVSMLYFSGMPGGYCGTWSRLSTYLDQEKRDWRIVLWTVQEQGEIFFKLSAALIRSLTCTWMLTFFWLFLGCEDGHPGGHPEARQGSRTQVFWAGDCCHVWPAFLMLLDLIWQHKHF